MKVLDQVRIVIYRFHEAGLEVFLINPELHQDKQIWRLPEGAEPKILNDNQYKVIELDDTLDTEGVPVKNYAIEADWHEIPSIRGIIKHDVKRLKNKVKKALPCLEQGSYVAVKEAIKKTMPQEYKALKELKDILTDRNTVTNF